MTETGTLHEAFVDELRDAYDAEQQLVKALPQMARAACSPSLREAFEQHLAETREQVSRLEQVFASIDVQVSGKHCAGIAGIIQEGHGVMDENFDDATLDACLIASGQRAEHYEIAAYGTLVAWARAMGNTDAADILEQILDEEKAADETLTALAEGGINQDAAEIAHAGGEVEEALLPMPMPEPVVKRPDKGRPASGTSAPKRRSKSARPAVRE